MHLFAFALAVPAPAAPVQEPYREPAPEVVAIVDAPPTPTVSFSPDGRFLLVIEEGAMPSIADVSRPMLRLAGVRIDPRANGRYRTRFKSGLVVRDLAGEHRTRVQLVEGARLDRVLWSHTSAHVAYTIVTDEGTELWVLSMRDPSNSTRVSRHLNTVLAGIEWTPDGEHLIFFEVPEERGEPPARPRVPRGPNVQETSDRTTPLRTYQDLLATPHDEALFAYYATSRPVELDLATGRRRALGAAGLYVDVEPAPGGELLLVTYLTGETSYQMPYSRFPRNVEVWDRSGALVHRVASVPMGEGIPIGGVRTGPRRVAWMPGEDATLVWIEALDGGDPEREADHRDRWLRHAAPFAGEPTEVVRVEHRAWGVDFLSPSRWITTEYDRDRRWVRALLHELAEPATEPVVLEDRSLRDRYGDPGNLVTRLDTRGSRIVVRDGPHVYRTGSGASPAGLLPFLDRLNLETLATERLWRCAEGSYEYVAEVLVGRGGLEGFVTRHETPSSPPNYRLRRAPGAEWVAEPGAEPVALTDFPDPTPQLRGVKKELVTYERADGVALSATLYLPADYREGQRLPLLVWAYPREFTDAGTAGQIGTSPWRFTRISGPSHLALLTQGYAILDGATMPVIGDPETMNDTFVEQVVGAAQAAIGKAVELGIADPERVGVGGHSYGAFMTANLLAHSDLFRAGVARSGAFNRTLTPFGFQAERRTLWEAPETYFAVSPFMHADGIAEPLLLIHGELDNNSGTYPLQSRRLFQAIQGNGGTARLVMLPSESHGYRARESVLHTLAEMQDWFDRHLAAPRAAEAAAPAAGRESSE